MSGLNGSGVGCNGIERYVVRTGLDVSFYTFGGSVGALSRDSIIELSW